MGHRADIVGRAGVLAAGLLVLALGSGCGGEQERHDPPPATGTTALDTAGIAPAAAESQDAGPGGSAAAAERTPPDVGPSAASPVSVETAAEGVREPGQEAFPEVPRAPLPPPEERIALPELVFHDLQGREVRLADLRGRVVLLDFWATWCRPCIMSIPHMVHLHETYEDAGLTLLALSLDQNGMAAVKPFLQKHPEIHYRVIPNGRPAAMTLGGIRSIPTTILLDREGRAVRSFVGLAPPELLEGYVQAALRE